MHALKLAPLAIALTFVARSADAGDPCPIGFVVVDAGIPEWANDELKAKVKDGDPFVEKLAAVAKKQSCTELRVAKRTKDALPVRIHDSVKYDLSMKKHHRKFYKSNRGFECKKAGKSLQELYEASYYGAPVVILRGHRRILVAVAGWKSTCVESAKADAMSDKDLLALWKNVTAPYVKDRHDNP